jgi:hypothetical protein
MCTREQQGAFGAGTPSILEQLSETLRRGLTGDPEIEANHGRIHVRSLPGLGCVFTIDLPRLPVTRTAAV